MRYIWSGSSPVSFCLMPTPATAVLGELLDLDAAAVVDAGTLDHLDRHLAAVVEIDARPAFEPLFEAAVDDLDGIGIHDGGTGGSAPGSPSPSPPHDQSAAADRTTHKKNRIFFIIGIFKIQSFQGFQRGDLCRKGYRPEQPPASRAAMANGRGIPCVPPAIGPCQTVKGLHGWTAALRYRIRPSHRTHRP